MFPLIKVQKDFSHLEAKYNRKKEVYILVISSEDQDIVPQHDS